MTFQPARVPAAASSCPHRPPPRSLRPSPPRSATAHAATTSAAAGIRTAARIDPDLRRALSQIDRNRIKTIITTLAGFGTRHTASSQTDPDRGIGAAIAT